MIATSGLSTLNEDQIAERGARPARREVREYREYLSAEQRSPPGCPAREVVLDQRGQATRSVAVHLCCCVAALACAVSAGSRGRLFGVGTPDAAQPGAARRVTAPNFVRLDVNVNAGGAAVTDLRPDELEVLDNGEPQRIEQLKHFDRAEPHQDSRAPAFVIFLDADHSAFGDSERVRSALRSAFDRIIDTGDLVAVMTSDMATGAIEWTTKDSSLDPILLKYAPWVQLGHYKTRDDSADADYRRCFPAIANELIQRRHEQASLDALERLTWYLRETREERTTVLAVTNGWPLFSRDPRLQRAAIESVDPGLRLDCDRDRLRLSMNDGREQFRKILDEANGALASVYPIVPDALDAPKGLATRDATRRAEASLRGLVEATNTSRLERAADLESMIEHISRSLSSYYVVGFHSTQPVDGRFHAITVRVKRPGVDVRARRGYWALDGNSTVSHRSDNAVSLVTGGEAGGSVAEAAASAVRAINGADQHATVRARAIGGWRRARDGAMTPIFWVTTEVDDSIPGADVQISVMLSSGRSLAEQTGHIPPGTSSVLVPVEAPASTGAGDYDIRIRCLLPAGEKAITTHATLQAAPRASGALFVRRFALAGHGTAPTADQLFRHGEQVQVEVPVVNGGDDVKARLLDRNGKRIPVPVSAGTRIDPDGSRWQTATVSTTPLARGDYVLELLDTIEGRESWMVAAFRVVR